MSEAPKLKPCPFCGSKDVYIENVSKRSRAHYIVLCAGCGARSREVTTGWPPRVEVERRTPFYREEAQKSAAEAWNRRAE